MRIVQLVEAAAAGVGRHVMDLTEGLLNRGHEVHLVYSDLRSDRVFLQDLRRLGEHAGFRARRILMRRELHAQDPLAARSLRRYLSTHGPFDLVHCHSTKAGAVGRIALVGHDAKRLYSPHGFFTMEHTRSWGTRRLAALLELALSKLCDGIIAVSRAEYQHAVELGISPTKLCLIPNGTSPALPPARTRAELREQWGIPDREISIGFVGRLVPQKSPDIMLRAFAELLQRAAAPVRLVMVGNGPLASPSKRLAAELGIQARVIWLGEQDAKTLMHAFDMLALTSDAEGHPLVVLEAMARGLPIVATRVGGIAETVRNGVNGFVAPVRDVAAIAASLGALVHDLALRENMGRASRILSRDFSVDRMVDRTLALYSQIAAGEFAGKAAGTGEEVAASKLSAAASR